VPVLGVEPAENVAKVAQAANIPTMVKFFGLETANALVQDGLQADLIVANNVLAQAPELNDFVYGIKTLLKPAGVVTVEVPHLVNLMEENQFDTIYHEH
jgi:trans-aconitate methyltransferase